MKTIITAVLAYALGAGTMWYEQARNVASILKSDDLSIKRNVEQANALLDIYEQELTKEQQQAAKDSIKRDSNGREVQ